MVSSSTHDDISSEGVDQLRALSDRFADEELPPQPRVTGERDWSFLRRPGWVLSHAFAVVMILGMVGLGFWQLDRLDQRQAENAIVAAQQDANQRTLADALALPLSDREYSPIIESGRFVEPELVRVANRSLGGAAGDWVVGVFETDAGQLVLVNRGFLAREAQAAPPDDRELTGWLRTSQVQDDTFGGTDTGDSFRVPRLDIDAIASRLSPSDRADLAPMWIQLAPPERAFAAPAAEPGVPQVPEAIPLPPLDEGSHLSYALQWFTFSIMGAVVYAMILSRRFQERV